MSPLISGLASVASMIFNAASSAPGKAAVTRRGSEEPPGPSSVVTLSAQAEALAGFAAKGTLVTQGGQGASLAAQRSAGAGALLAQSGQPGKAVSAEDFGQLLARFGADDAQKAQLTEKFDTDHDGSISRGEFLKGLASVAAPGADSDFSQAVLQLMDRSGQANGVVTAQEFAALTTAFAQAEKSGGLA